MSRRRRSTPQRPTEGVRRLLDDLVPDDGLSGVQRAWSGAVGPTIAAAGRPVAVVDGVLHVQCEDATWAQELQLLEREILARLRADGSPGTSGIRALRARAGGA